jgi:hypothetical protein
MFLTQEFIVFGIKFQNWMIVFAAIVLLFLLYFWIMSRRNSR